MHPVKHFGRKSRGDDPPLLLSNALLVVRDHNGQARQATQHHPFEGAKT